MVWEPGEANPKQKLFYRSRSLYTAYGGAKGGGKTHAVRTKAIGGALLNPGIRILIMRCTYPELEENHIRPIVKMLPPEVGSYNGSTHLISFCNGSTIRFGHWNGEASEQEYNGQEYTGYLLTRPPSFPSVPSIFLGAACVE